jgi:hypothetical protein
MYNNILGGSANQKRILSFSQTQVANEFVGGAYCPQNGKTYFAPYQAAGYIGEYDPSTKLITDIPFDTAVVGSITGAGNRQYCQGVVYAPNNKMYFIPYNASHIIVYDVINFTFQYIAGFSGGSEGKFNGGVIASDGFLYMIPWQATNITRIDTALNTITTFGEIVANRNLGGVLFSDNCIYQPPTAHFAFRKIDLTTEAITTFGNFGNSSVRWINGCNGLDNKIYYAPLIANTVLILDPVNQTSVQLNISGLGGSAFYGNLQLAPNGNLYALSFSANRFLEVIPGRGIARSFYLNGNNIYHGNSYSPQGILGVPRTASRIKLITNIGLHKSEYTTFPSDLSTIAASDWNKFQQTL